MEDWKPTLIDIEIAFTKFIETYRGGKTLEEFLGVIPDGIFNADFFIEDDQVIGELKCLSSDPNDNAVLKAKRLANSFKNQGLTEDEIFEAIQSGRPLPNNVRRRLFNIETRSIVAALEKANRQLRATKILLGKPEAKCVTFLANDRNFGFNPSEIMYVIGKTFKQFRHCHTDCVIYFTPNVYHDLGDDIAHILWLPIYNVGSEDFADYINPLGTAWFNFHEKLGEPFIAKKIGDGTELYSTALNSEPIIFDN